MVTESFNTFLVLRERNRLLSLLLFQLLLFEGHHAVHDSISYKLLEFIFLKYGTARSDTTKGVTNDHRARFNDSDGLWMLQELFLDGLLAFFITTNDRRIWLFRLSFVNFALLTNS